MKTITIIKRTNSQSLALYGIKIKIKEERVER